MTFLIAAPALRAGTPDPASQDRDPVLAQTLPTSSRPTAELETMA